jgi:hypothetical protein
MQVNAVSKDANRYNEPVQFIVVQAQLVQNPKVRHGSWHTTPSLQSCNSGPAHRKDVDLEECQQLDDRTCH